MKELLYFSFAELMVRVEYNNKANSLRYATHRRLTYTERVIVEQYLLTNMALKTEYYRREPALFVYIGIDAGLLKDLKLFRIKSTLKTLVDKERDVKASVTNLINQSMLNFYFEKIGDTILAIRDGVNRCVELESLQDHRSRLEALVDAYNAYAEQKIDVKNVLPSDLQEYLRMK